MIAFARRYALWADALVGVIVAGVGIAVAATSDNTRGALWVNVVALVAMGACLAFRNRRPVPAAYGFPLVIVVMAIWLLPPQDTTIVFLGLLLLPYTAATSHHASLSRAYLPVLVVAITIANLLFDRSQTGDFLFPVALAVAAWGAGRNAVYRSRLAAELHETTLRAEEAQSSDERRAVAAERRRIAREMHDVVAHSISVMVVQAGGARRVLARDPDRAADAAAAIESTGRETLLEMRRLLGVMHPGEAPAELEPTPTLADLQAMCERAGARLQVLGHPQPLPSGLEVGAFRVVQEALADVERVTPGARAEVTLEWTPLALSIRIADSRPFAGYELVGVRERVDLYGGSVTAGPRPQGTGHQVSVRLPLPEAVPEGAPTS